MTGPELQHQGPGKPQGRSLGVPGCLLPGPAPELSVAVVKAGCGRGVDHHCQTQRAQEGSPTQSLPAHPFQSCPSQTAKVGLGEEAEEAPPMPLPSGWLLPGSRLAGQMDPQSLEARGPLELGGGGAAQWLVEPCVGLLFLGVTGVLPCREWFAVWVGNLAPKITQQALLHYFQP